MIQRILNSKNFLAFLLASATGMYFYFVYPFPSANLFLRAVGSAHRSSIAGPSAVSIRELPSFALWAAAKPVAACTPSPRPILAISRQLVTCPNFPDFE